MHEVVKGFVAAVLTERELVLNRGHEHGVVNGMKFKVLEKPQTIKDPQTEEEIGSIQREKIRVIVYQVQPKLSLAQTYQTYEQVIPEKGNRNSIFRDFQPPESYEPARVVKRVKTLRRDEASNLPPIDEKSSLVQRGDPVEEILEAPATK